MGALRASPATACEVASWSRARARACAVAGASRAISCAWCAALVLRASRARTSSSFSCSVLPWRSCSAVILVATIGEGVVVMVPNDARNIWVTATTLTTALNLGIITYVFSGPVICFGLVSIWTGLIFFALKRNL